MEAAGSSGWAGVLHLMVVRPDGSHGTCWRGRVRLLEVAVILLGGRCLAECAPATPVAGLRQEPRRVHGPVADGDWRRKVNDARYGDQGRPPATTT